MKSITKIGMAVLAAALWNTAQAQNQLGNQLQSGKPLPPITERPATVIGPVDGLTAAEGTQLYSLQTGSVVYILGDSTLHKYELGAKSLKGSALVKGPLTQALKSGVVKAALDVPVTSLKSKESGLDDNAYKALKAKENPEILFSLKSVKVAGENATLKGDLIIAGVTQPVVLNAQAKVTGNSVELIGVQKLKMTDYQITPPSVSLVVTSITCTDEIEVHYDVTFASVKEEAAH